MTLRNFLSFAIVMRRVLKRVFSSGVLESIKIVFMNSSFFGVILSTVLSLSVKLVIDKNTKWWVSEMQK